MSEYMTLLGAEDVSRAGNRMVSAAEDMQRAAVSMDDTLERNRRHMDDWLLRFDAVIERLEKALTTAAKEGT